MVSLSEKEMKTVTSAVTCSFNWIDALTTGSSREGSEWVKDTCAEIGKWWFRKLMIADRSDPSSHFLLNFPQKHDRLLFILSWRKIISLWWIDSWESNPSYCLQHVKQERNMMINIGDQHHTSSSLLPVNLRRDRILLLVLETGRENSRSQRSMDMTSSLNHLFFESLAIPNQSHLREQLPMWSKNASIWKLHENCLNYRFLEFHLAACLILWVIIIGWKSSSADEDFGLIMLYHE